MCNKKIKGSENQKSKFNEIIRLIITVNEKIESENNIHQNKD